MRNIILAITLVSMILPFYGCEPYQAPPEKWKVFDKDVLYHIEKNPRKYIGELYAFQGRVLQAHESNDGIVFQMLTGNCPGSYRTGPSLTVSFGRSDTPVIEGSWV